MTDAAENHDTRPNPRNFIQENLLLVPVRSVQEIRLYTAHSGSGLRRLGEAHDIAPPPPYWAHQWAGGMVLARHFLDRPDVVAGRRVLDLGAGGGIVGIAAAKAGARSVTAAEIDPYGVAAIGLNAEANGVAIRVIGDDLLEGPAAAVDLVAVGDLFYEHDLAGRVTVFLDRCRAAGIEVLIGDPGRAHLPRSRLRLLAEYKVPDFGEARDAAMKKSGVFSLVP